MSHRKRKGSFSPFVVRGKKDLPLGTPPWLPIYRFHKAVCSGINHVIGHIGHIPFLRCFQITLYRFTKNPPSRPILPYAWILLRSSRRQRLMVQSVPVIIFHGIDMVTVHPGNFFFCCLVLSILADITITRKLHPVGRNIYPYRLAGQPLSRLIRQPYLQQISPVILFRRLPGYGKRLLFLCFQRYALGNTVNLLSQKRSNKLQPQVFRTFFAFVADCQRHQNLFSWRITGLVGSFYHNGFFLLMLTPVSANQQQNHRCCQHQPLPLLPPSVFRSFSFAS